MHRRRLASLLLIAACNTSGAGGSGDGTSDGGTAADGSAGPTSADDAGSSDTGSSASAGTSADDGGSSDGGSDSGGSGGGDLDIGEWVDMPGACPDGTTQVDITTIDELNAASRGEGDYADDGPGTCYFIHDGEYSGGSDPAVYITHGGTTEAPIYFVGESRDGVHIVGRAGMDQDGSHVVLRNMTFDLTGYSHDDSFNTVSVMAVEDITIDHVTFTGDCATGANGGHIETVGTNGLHVEACLIERFGRCGPEGHQDHGIYLADGDDITIVNNVIRENASRGIQLYTGSGEGDTLGNVTIERNRIHDNGHGDYEDGIAINGQDAGTIDTVAIRRNLFYSNYYSGIRFAGNATSAITIEHNTFAGNGAGSSSESRSEINIDGDSGGAANATISGNIFAIGNLLINDCMGSDAMAFSIADNVASGPIAAGDDACVGSVVDADPQFVDAAGADFHTGNPAVAEYGAYAP